MLIVEDDKALRKMVRVALESDVRGLEIEEARDGWDALKRSRVHRPDVVVLDLDLPGMSGTDLLQRLRDEPSLSSVGVVLLTAAGHLPADFEALEGKADELLAKPFTSTDILSRVHRLLA